MIGDFGAGTSEQLAVARRMCEWRQRHPFDIVVTTGDNVYQSGDPAQFEDNFFEPMSCLLRAGVRFHATLGNHDVVTDGGRSEVAEPAFGMPASDYVVRYSGVRFVMADSNSLDREWLQEALPSRRGDRWTVVVFHHPVFSSGVHGTTQLFHPVLPELLEVEGVDLVLNGHDHDYEVTKPLNGIRYVVTGGGGADVRPCERSWFTDGECISRHHFVYVETGPRRIVVRAIPVQGAPFDRFATTGLP